MSKDEIQREGRTGENQLYGLIHDVNPPHKSILSKGFTLIELLVVVGVIAILASILLPALKSAMDKASGTLCANIERKISLAANYYSLDWNDYILSSESKYKPTSTSWEARGLCIYGYRGLEYIKPLDEHFGTFYGSMWCPVIERNYAASPNFVYPYGTYAIPWCIGNSIIYAGTPYAQKYLKTSALPSPSLHVYFGESANGAASQAIVKKEQNLVPIMTSGVDYAHNKRANFCFFDSHLETFGEAELPEVPGIAYSNVVYPW